MTGAEKEQLFPQLFGCGPIEAAQPQTQGLKTELFPQLFGCGPIEAGI